MAASEPSIATFPYWMQKCHELLFNLVLTNQRSVLRNSVLQRCWCTNRVVAACINSLVAWIIQCLAAGIVDNLLLQYDTIDSLARHRIMDCINTMYELDFETSCQWSSMSINLFHIDYILTARESRHRHVYEKATRRQPIKPVAQNVDCLAYAFIV